MMYIISGASFLLGTTVVFAQDWQVNIYGQTGCSQDYFTTLSFSNTDEPFSYNYGINSAVVVGGPPGGFCDFFIDSQCQDSVGDQSRSEVDGGGCVDGIPGYTIQCWTCQGDVE